MLILVIHFEKYVNFNIYYYLTFFIKIIFAFSYFAEILKYFILLMIFLHLNVFEMRQINIYNSWLMNNYVYYDYITYEYEKNYVIKKIIRILTYFNEVFSL